MNPASFITILYGVIVLIGGLIGYMKASSQVSLITGSLFGIGLIIAGLGTALNWSWAFHAALTLMVLLAVFFAIRFYTTGAWMPAGIMLIISIVAIISTILFVYK